MQRKSFRTEGRDGMNGESWRCASGTDKSSLTAAYQPVGTSEAREVSQSCAQTTSTIVLYECTRVSQDWM